MNSTCPLLLALVCVASLQAADYYVAPDGTDNGNGSASRPFRTIQKGLDAATQPGDTVTVLPGTYSEQLILRARGAPGKPILIRAAKKHGAILDGAERVRGWQLLDSARNIWTKEFGSKAPYNNDNGRWDMPPRSEQVFVDGKRCVHAKDTLSDYSFAATLTEPARYTLKLPHGLNPNTSVVEITTKTNLLRVRADHVVIEGFVFRRAQNTYQNAMVTLQGEGIEFRDNLLEYSSAGSGLAIQTRRSHIHGNIFRHNGQFGFAVGGTDNRIENNLVEGNDLAGYKEWGTGGTKIVGNGNILRRNRFVGNLGGVAIWLDCGPCNSIIESNYVAGNFGEGIRAEISFHSLIAHNTIENTQECVPFMFGKLQQPHCIGISVQNSAETRVVHNLLKDNRGVDIQLATYNRKATDLPPWQERYEDARHRDWLRRSWEAGVIYAYSNLFLSNVVLKTTAEAAPPRFALMGLTNGQKPHCFGNLFDANIYSNLITQTTGVLSPEPIRNRKPNQPIKN